MKVSFITYRPTNGGSDIDQLANILNELTMHPSSNVQCASEKIDNDRISNPTKMNNILPEVKSKVVKYR